MRKAKQWLASLSAGMFTANIRRPEAGFEWAERPGGFLARPFDQDDSLPAGPWLIPRGPFTKATAVLRRRNLLDDFINVGHAPSRDAILKLANGFGPLHDPMPVVRPGKYLPPFVDSYQAWERATRRIALLAWLWRHVQEGDARALSPFVVWQRTPKAIHIQIVEAAGVPLAEPTRRFWRHDRSHQSAPFDPLISSGATNTDNPLTDADRLRALVPESYGVRAFSTTMAVGEALTPVPEEIMDGWIYGDVIAPLEYFVRAELNGVLAQHVKYQIMHDGRNSPGLVPDSLYAAVYVKLSDWISGDGSYVRRCQNPGCGRLYRTNRRDKKTCSDSCRATKSRHTRRPNKTATDSF